MRKPLFGEGSVELISELREKSDKNVNPEMLYEQIEKQAHEEYEANKAKESEVEKLSEELKSFQF
jgi:hypothetical protein